MVAARMTAAAALATAVVAGSLVATVSTPAASGSPGAANAIVAAPPPRVGASAPAHPHRAAPAYVKDERWYIRTAPGSGPFDFAGEQSVARGAVPFFGDWDGNGTFTPGYFVNGSWVLYTTFVGGPRTSTRSVTSRYGTTGDRPAVGDWNGDGRTDIAVLRAGTWHQRDAGSTTTSRTFRYGAAGDRPVVGDWNGDGRDSVGVRRGATFYLSDRNAAGSSHYAFAYGYTSDQPVAGDWDGNGSDSVGVVRGDRWFTQSDSTRRVTSTLTMPRPASTVPVAFASPAGPAGDACPTVSPRFAASASYVVPPTRVGGAMPDGGELRAALQTAERFLLGARFEGSHGLRAAQRYLSLRARHPVEEHAIRPAAMSALTVAVGVSLDGFDEGAVGRTRAWAIDYLDWLLRSLACQHRAVSPGGWGVEWQSDLLAHYAGLAAWLVWDELAPQTQVYVEAMVAAEAVRKAGTPVEFWKNRAGVEQVSSRSGLPRVGDSAAEEMAWEAGSLGFAATMMPAHPQAGVWRAAGTRKAVAAFSRQADLTSGTSVNGIQLASLAGFNADGDGLVVNHSIRHPDYTSTVAMLWETALPALLSGRALPAGYLHNGRVVWEALTRTPFGGSPIYRPDGELNYPDGPGIWGTKRYATFMGFDALAGVVGADIDPESGVLDDVSGWDWAAVHLAKVRQLQRRFADGHMYVADASPPEFSYLSAEELSAVDVALTWAANYARLHLGRLALDGGPLAG